MENVIRVKRNQEKTFFFLRSFSSKSILNFNYQKDIWIFIKIILLPKPELVLSLQFKKSLHFSLKGWLSVPADTSLLFTYEYCIHTSSHKVTRENRKILDTVHYY